MELLAFLGGVLGLIAAIMNRKRIVYHVQAPYNSVHGGAGPTRRIPIVTRFRRVALLAVGTVTLLLLTGAAAEANSDTLANIFVVGVFVCFMCSAYQAVAILITFVSRIWRG